MGSTFNHQILVEKLAKLNSTQQSIEKLSHWCIFHMNKATQVVETWARQYHCAPRDQRLAFLYLANDILQNSRRKGAEFVAEFWKVLPDALRDVIQNGDEFGKNAAMRLVNIWEERKVFGSRGQLLKEEFVKKPLDNGNRNPKHGGFKLRPPGGNALEKLISGYQAVYGNQLDEEALFSKCKNAISFVEKVDKDIEGDYGLGHVNGSIRDELKGQDAILRDCIEQLTVVESSRQNLLSILREAVQEQEYKLDQVRGQLQAAQSRSEQAGTICRQLLVTNSNGQSQSQPDQIANVGQPQIQPPTYVPSTGEQSTSVIYTRQVPITGKSDDPKSAAAAMAAKLTASTSSAQMLTYVLSSLASEGVIIGNQVNDSSSSKDYPPEKRAKIENDHPYIPENAKLPTEPPPPPPPPPSSPPPLPPLPPPYQVPQYMQTASYGYDMSQQPPAAAYAPVGIPVNGVSTFAPPASAYQSYTTEGGFYGPPSTLPAPQ